METESGDVLGMEATIATVSDTMTAAREVGLKKQEGGVSDAKMVGQSSEENGVGDGIEGCGKVECGMEDEYADVTMEIYYLVYHIIYYLCQT